MAEMVQGLQSTDKPTQFHIGLQHLGDCLGANTSLRDTSPGAPDVVWVFPNLCIAIEAKSDKEDNGQLSKADLLEASGHENWVRAHDALSGIEEIQTVIIAPTSQIHQVGKPHTKKLYYSSIVALQKCGKDAAHLMNEIRGEYFGKEYSENAAEIKAKIKRKHLDIETIRKSIFDILKKD